MLSDLKLEPLAEHHNRSAFSCGAPSVDRYLKTVARQDVDRHSSAVWVLAKGSEIIGYYALSGDIIRKDLMPDMFIKKFGSYRDRSVTLLSQLGVDVKYQRQGIASHLLADALSRSYRQTTQIGSIGVVVDLLSDNMRSFYEKHDFVSLPHSPNRVFIGMERIGMSMQLSQERLSKDVAIAIPTPKLEDLAKVAAFTVQASRGSNLRLDETRLFIDLATLGTPSGMAKEVVSVGDIYQASQKAGHVTIKEAIASMEAVDKGTEKQRNVPQEKSLKEAFERVGDDFTQAYQSREKALDHDVEMER